jgi:hypothetical protein
VSEGIPSRDIVHQQRPCCTSVKLCCYAFELLLTRGVIDLKFDISLFFSHSISVIINFDHPRTEINPDREIMLCAEPLICELHEKTTFSHARVTDDDVLEQKRIRHR